MKRALSFLLINISISLTYSQNQSLDLQFGNNGISINDVNLGSSDKSIDVIALTNGKSIVVGKSDNNLTLIRYNNDGIVDISFGNNGVISHSSPDLLSYDIKAKLYSDKILITGTGYENGNTVLRIYKFNLEGTLDFTFGINGILNINLNAAAFCKSVKVQSDNKIVLGGYLYNGNFSVHHFFLTRLTENGVLDNTFGTNGIIIHDATTSDRAYDMDLQSDDKIILVGEKDAITDNKYIVYRFNTDGTLDNSFNSGMGKFLSESGTGSAKSVYVLADDKILISGSTNLYRLNANGTVDLTFGVNGIVTGVPGEDIEHKNNKIIIINESSNFSFNLSLLDDNGNLIFNFGTNGVDSIDVPIAVHDYFFTLQDDGKVLITASAANSFDFLLIRCIDFVNISSITTIENAKPNISIYPNPFSNQINFELIDQDLGNFTIEISDLLGKKILSKQLNNKLEFSEFNNGEYLYEIFKNNENRDLIQKGKVVKN